MSVKLREIIMSDLNERERTTRLETLMEVLSERLKSIEDKIDALSAMDADRRIRDLEKELKEVKRGLHQDLIEVRKLIKEYENNTIDDKKDTNNSFDAMNLKIDTLFTFRAKMLMIGTVVVIALTFIATAFGADISAFFGTFFGSG